MYHIQIHIDYRYLHICTQYIDIWGKIDVIHLTKYKIIRQLPPLRQNYFRKDIGTIVT